MSPQRVQVTVDGRTLQLSNLDKLLYPDAGFTKAEVLDYYSRVAPYILPHLADRPLTMNRFPNGVTGQSFFEKNKPSHTPSWVRTVRLPVPGSSMNRDEIDFVVCDDLATLVWLANLAALELHVPQWTVGPRGEARPADLLVFDLDPGPPASIVECAEVACLLRTEIGRDSLTGYPKTSGRKGMQVYAPIAPAPDAATSAYAKDLAQRLEATHPTLVLSRMTRSLRPGKVFVDWSQNNAAKTTVAPYSLRAVAQPTVSTPLRWAEVESGRPLRFTAGEVLARVEEHGDLFAGLRTADRPALPR
ncbi:MAG TPA: non-homologous end-joining DNA ligase [Mycobacteriales bacterium]|nr:non-homologous end-joining DNA ligase [Mycobacteriales bacterium]